MQRYKEKSKVEGIYAKLHFFEDKTSVLSHFFKDKISDLLHFFEDKTLYNVKPNPTLKGTALISEPNICVKPKRPKRIKSWNFKVVKIFTPNGL